MHNHNKEELRNRVKNLLKKMDKGLHAALSVKIAEAFFQTNVWKNAKTVGLTISKGGEVDTNPLIAQGWLEGKRIAAPKCDPETKTMEFREFISYDQLENVYLDLKEPIVEETTAVSPEEIDLLIVPGICFDRYGYRIGYGGGYYDRYLKKYSNTAAALAFSLQIVEKVPAEQHDLPVGLIVTENEIMECGT